MSKELNSFYESLNSICTEMHICASVWGSFQRNELTPFSDIDIICFSDRSADIDKLHYSFEKALSKDIHTQHRWDIAFIVGSPYDYALINGTNYHSVFFSDLVVGERDLVSIFERERERLRNKSELVIREFFNLFTSFFGLARVLNTKDARYAKFSMDGTNKWVRLVQASQLRWHNLIGKTSKDIIASLGQRYSLDVTHLIKAYELDFFYRIESEKDGVVKQNSATYSTWHKLFQSFILDCIPWVQSNTGVSSLLLQEFCQSVGITDVSAPSPKNDNPYAEAVIDAFLAQEPQKIHALLDNNTQDWWIMTNLCVNERVPSSVLDKIVFPDFKVDPILWKSVRLYVAKNKYTSINTLQQILHTEGLREQDYLAAHNNLDSRT